MHTVTNQTPSTKYETHGRRMRVKKETLRASIANEIRGRDEKEKNWPLCAQRKIIFIGIVNICTRKSRYWV